MIVGLVGFAGSGKGTVGDILVSQYGFVQESFAKSLKDAASIIFGWERHLLEGDTKESREFRETVDQWWKERLGWSITPRLALQLLGTECGRQVFGNNIWVSSFMRRIENRNAKVVVTDVRFANEIAAITSNGGKIVYVKRGIDPIWYDLAAECNIENTPELMQKQFPDIHPSEWSWIGRHHDIVFDNNCDFNEIPIRVASLVDSLYNNRVEEVIEPEVHNATIE